MEPLGECVLFGIDLLNLALELLLAFVVGGKCFVEKYYLFGDLLVYALTHHIVEFINELCVLGDQSTWICLI